MAPSTPAGEMSLRIPGWAVGFVRAGSLVAMFFGLVSLTLMMSGAPKYPIYWPTVWTTIGLVLFGFGVFVGSFALSVTGAEPRAAEATAAASLGARAAVGAPTGDEEVYETSAPVVDVEKQVTTTPGNDLGDGAPVTQRRALAASAIERLDSENEHAAPTEDDVVDSNGSNGAAANTNIADQQRFVRP